MTSIYEALNDVIARELSLKSLRLAPETEMDDLPGWDSVTMAGVLLELESRFDVTFERSDVEKIRTAADLAALIQP